ncbi:MAG: DUF438 domain-containing protein [Candidatus Fermentithermobacillus carboniphilus]|uniref:DUF438 domain-containing protein n=1 Tax=Candidatus Fermentithermobacillus carboniphilus TaxID=3085328 RepID=A0AAT9LAN0_9FIRM|nr:MAG: DUF438 domain-containing protein [Candidatus Fermentithermobacillus carboniphilus]
MSDAKIDRLAQDLLRINRGEMEVSEAKRLLQGIDEVELSLAEQRLLEKGVSPEQLRGLCKVHLEVLDRQVQDLKESTGPGHPLHTLISEHELILGFIDSVEKVAKAFSTKSSWSKDAEEERLLEILVESAYELVETEKHHQREEEALFPAIERQGITGPTRIMRLEHEELRPKKKALLETARKARQMEFETFNAKLQELSSFIAFNLREHIFKENTILYPAAFKAINDPFTWEDIKRKCDEIGYCCFTPAM